MSVQTSTDRVRSKVKKFLTEFRLFFLILGSILVIQYVPERLLFALSHDEAINLQHSSDKGVWTVSLGSLLQSTQGIYIRLPVNEASCILRDDQGTRIHGLANVSLSDRLVKLATPLNARTLQVECPPVQTFDIHSLMVFTSPLAPLLLFFRRIVGLGACVPLAASLFFMSFFVIRLLSDGSDPYRRIQATKVRTYSIAAFLYGLFVLWDDYSEITSGPIFSVYIVLRLIFGYVTCSLSFRNRVPVWVKFVHVLVGVMVLTVGPESQVEQIIRTHFEISTFMAGLMLLVPVGLLIAVQVSIQNRTMLDVDRFGEVFSWGNFIIQTAALLNWSGGGAAISSPGTCFLVLALFGLTLVTGTVESIRYRNTLHADRIFSMLAKNVIHDIRSPLALLKTLISRPDDFEVVAASQAVRRLSGIANDLLEWNRVTSPESVGMRGARLNLEQIRNVVREIVAEKNGIYSGRVQFEGPSQLQSLIGVTALGTLTGLERVISNLIENALQVTPQGEVVRVRILVQAHTIEVQVIDTGPGFPRGVDTDNLGAQVTTVGKKDGNGLGLYFAAKFAKSCNGKLSAHRRDQKTVVTLILNSD